MMRNHRPTLLASVGVVVVAAGGYLLYDSGPRAEDFFRADAVTNLEITVDGRAVRDSEPWNKSQRVVVRGTAGPGVLGNSGCAAYIYFVPKRAHDREEILVIPLHQEPFDESTGSDGAEAAPLKSSALNLEKLRTEKDGRLQFWTLWGLRPFPKSVDPFVEEFDVQFWVYPQNRDEHGSDVQSTGILFHRLDLRISGGAPEDN